MVFNKLLEAMFNSMNVNEAKFYTSKGRFFDLNNNNEQQKKKDKNFVHLNLRSKNNSVIFEQYI